ncbi:transposase [Lentibacillus salicampi]|uniref:Transposase n=2 Tax=Lentibacillus salicampi TaxID=175306 RepID=A0A4Y9A876_9BACI|nr:transposase [Lentibacillus salicampi]
MKLFLVAGSIVLSVVMYLTQNHWYRLRFIFNVAAVICALIFGNITSLSIYQIIKDGTVMMTAIHAVFLNPLFLMTGSFLGLYMIYRILAAVIEE